MVDILCPMLLRFPLKLKMETVMIPCSLMMGDIHSHPLELNGQIIKKQG